MQHNLAPLDIFTAKNTKATFQIRQAPPENNNPKLRKQQQLHQKQRAPSKKFSVQHWIALSILVACLSASNPLVSANDFHASRISSSRISSSIHAQQSPAFWDSRRSRQSGSLNPMPASFGTSALQIRGGAVSSKSKSVATPPTSKEVAVSEVKEDGRILMLIRVLFLLYYGSLGSLMPYLPVYYHSLGHGGQIIGMLGAVKPLTTFLVAPIWGALSDGSSNPFLILKLTFVISLVGQLAVSFSHDHLYIMFMVFLTALFNAPVKSLLDSMVMDHLHHRSTYGRLRLWGQLGFGLGSSGMGYLLSKSKNVDWKDTFFSESFEAKLQKYPALISVVLKWASQFWQSLTEFKLLFFAHAALSLPTWICIRQFQKLDAEAKIGEGEKAIKNNSKSVEKKASEAPASAEHLSVGRGLSLVFRNPDALLFFFLVLVVGVSSGLIENFAYVRIREVGGTGKEMGISRLVSSLAGAPMFWFSGPLSKALGVDRVLVVSLLNYVLRFLIYSMMRNPYHGLPAEALRGLTFAAFWSSCTIYAHKVSPPGLHATMLMLLNALYGGLGQSLGAILGGKMQHAMGTVKTFYFAAAADAVFVLAVMFYLSVRTESNFRDPQPIEDPQTKKES